MKKTSLLGLLALCASLTAHSEMTTAENYLVPEIEGATVTRVISPHELLPGDKILIRVHSALYAEDPFLTVNNGTTIVKTNWANISDMSTALFTIAQGSGTFAQNNFHAPYTSAEKSNLYYQIKFGDKYLPNTGKTLSTAATNVRLVKVTSIPGSTLANYVYEAETNPRGLFMINYANQKVSYTWDATANDASSFELQTFGNHQDVIYYNGWKNDEVNSNAATYAAKYLTPFFVIYRVRYNNETSTNTTYNRATGNTAGGWYTIKCNQVGNDTHTANALNNYIANMDEEHFQSGTNCYSLRWNRSVDANYVKGPGDDGYEQETKKAKKFIWIKHTSTSATTYNFRSINGHWVQKNSCSARVGNSLTTDAATNVPVGAGASGSGNNIGKWSVFGPGTDAGYNRTFSVVGGGSGTTFYYDIEPADVSDYEIYSVVINDAPNSTRPNIDPAITYTGVNNCGIDKVYNGGTYFFTKNTVPASTDFVVENTGVYGQSDFVIDVNAETKTIRVHNQNNHNDSEYAQPGWYTIKCTQSSDQNIANKYIINAEKERRQGAENPTCYPLRWDTDNSAQYIQKLIYISYVSGNNYNFRSINGHWLAGGCGAALSATAVTIANGNGKIGTWHSYNDNADAVHESDGFTYVGGSSDGSTYNYYEIKPANVDNYDVYTLKIIGGLPSGTHVSADNYVTLKEGVTCASSSITKIYNGGYFFFDKDTEVSPEDFEVQEINGGAPVVTIEEIDGVKTIKVDYEAITAQSEMLLANADAHAGNGLNQYVFTGIDELREKYNAYVAMAEDAEDRDAAKAELISAYNAVTYTINPVEKNKFIRISAALNTSHCIYDEGTRFTYIIDEEHNRADDIFYYTPAGHLVSYKYGYAVKDTGGTFDTHCEPADHVNMTNAFTFTFVGTDSRYLGHYVVEMQGSTSTRNPYWNNGGMSGGTNAADPTNGQVTLDGYKHYSFDVEYVNALPVDIHADGYGAVVCPLALAVPSDVTAYVAKVDGNKMSFDAVSVIPAGAHALIKADGKQSVTLPLATSEDVATAYDNLKGHHLTRIVTPAEGNSIYSKVNPNAAAATDAEEALGAKLYRLDANDDGQVIVPAGSFAVEMATPKDNPESITVDPVGAEVTLGIEELSTINHQLSTIYDLQGRKLTQPAKGINIIGGRKVLVK